MKGKQGELGPQGAPGMAGLSGQVGQRGPKGFPGLPGERVGLAPCFTGDFSLIDRICRAFTCYLMFL